MDDDLTLNPWKEHRMSIREMAAQALAEQRAAAEAERAAEKAQRVVETANLARKWLSDRGITPDSVTGTGSKYELPSFVVEGIPMRLTEAHTARGSPPNYVATVKFYYRPNSGPHYRSESASWYDLASLGRALEQIDRYQAEHDTFTFTSPGRV